MSALARSPGGAGEVTVSYDDLAPVLEAGYLASLGCGGGETAHFVVIKNRRQKIAARTFIESCQTSWKQYFPEQDPTFIVVFVNPKSVSAGRTKEATIENHCASILRAMNQSAGSRGMRNYATLRHGDVEPEEGVRDLLVPRGYVPAGVFAVAGGRPGE